MADVKQTTTIWRVENENNWCWLLQSLLTVKQLLVPGSRLLIIAPILNNSKLKHVVGAWLNRLKPDLSVTYMSYYELLKVRSKPSYALDFYKASTLVQRNHPALSNTTFTLWDTLQPLMELLDAHHLGADEIIIDRRVAHSYNALNALLDTLIWSLSGPEGKQSRYALKVIGTCIDHASLKLPFRSDCTSLLSLTAQMHKVFCPPSIIDNPLYLFARECILETVAPWMIWREEKYGGPLAVVDADHLTTLVDNKQLFPNDLKSAVLDFLTLRLADRLFPHIYFFFYA